MNNSITLVVADDHPLLLSGLIDQLETYNYNVIASAENGAQALDKIMELQPTIAILDEEMPMLTGFEVIQKCKEKQVATKFIILTSHKEKAFIYKAQKLNISGYIIKDEPFT
jgi:YesN/AraC family two-component response regulator